MDISNCSRRKFLKSIAAGAASFAVSGMGGKCASKGGAQDDKPNFVLIFTDDQGYRDLSCFGSPISTPNIDRMAEEGMKFTDFYATASICTPSRASIITGCYSQRVSIPGVLWPWSKEGLNPEEITIAEVLKGRGYSTACIGKWHLGEPPTFSPNRHGFDYFYGLPFTNDRPRPMYKDPEFTQGWTGFDSFPRLMRNDKVIEAPTNRALLTKRCTEEAIKFIRDYKEHPFFVYLAHPMPHVELGVQPGFEGKSGQDLYGDVIAELDWSVGEILKTLKELGLDEKTLVVFTSDNGPWLSEGKDGGSALPLKSGKFSTYEGGMREPCVMRWPGKIPAGTVCREISSIMDFLPTFASLAGAKLSTDRVIDGKDIRPLMTGEVGAKSPYEAFLYYEAGGYKLEAIRRGKWKLHFARGPKQPYPKYDYDKKPFPLQLYDLEADVAEEHNLADKYPQIVEKLRKLAKEMDKELKANTRPPGKLQTS